MYDSLLLEKKEAKKREKTISNTNQPILICIQQKSTFHALFEPHIA